MNIQSGIPAPKFVEDKQQNFLADPSLWFLVIANIATIYFAVAEGWSLPPLMFIYWSQSVIIGFFNFARILLLKNFSTEGFKINGRPAAPTQGTKISTAFFFAIHYGIFHLAYLLFILNNSFRYAEGNIEMLNFSIVMVPILIFLLNHSFSFFYNRRADEERRSNIGAVMFYPYARIIPMHLTIIFGGILGVVGLGLLALLLFMFLKLAADVIMHAIEHSGSVPKIV